MEQNEELNSLTRKKITLVKIIDSIGENQTEEERVRVLEEELSEINKQIKVKTQNIIDGITESPREVESVVVTIDEINKAKPQVEPQITTGVKLIKEKVTKVNKIKNDKIKLEKQIIKDKKNVMVKTLVDMAAKLTDDVKLRRYITHRSYLYYYQINKPGK